MSKEEQREFAAEVTAYLLEEIENGADVFVVLGFKDKGERNKMRISSYSVKASLNPADDRMVEIAHKMVEDFMDKNAQRWREN